MNCSCRKLLNESQQQESKNKSGSIIDRKTDSAPFVPALILRRSRRTAEDLRGHRGNKVNPHAKQSEPREELDHRQRPHRFGHRGDTQEDFAKGISYSGGLRFRTVEFLKVFRGILLRGYDR